MAITQSGLYLRSFRDQLNATQLSLDLITDVVKCAMFTNSLTAPSFTLTGDTAYTAAPYTTNEVSGTGYTATGNALTTKAWSESPSGTLVYSADAVQWTSSTISNARGALLYDVTKSNRCVCFVNFGADYSTTSGTFTIQWNAAGIFKIQLA